MSHRARGGPAWALGQNHSAQRWQNRMQRRGWTPAQITEAIQGGQSFPAPNHVNPWSFRNPFRPSDDRAIRRGGRRDERGDSCRRRWLPLLMP